MAPEIRRAAAVGHEMRLRYKGVCVGCNTPLSAGTSAFYDRFSRNVTCFDCGSDAPLDEAIVDESSELLTVGTPGASALREYERRRDVRHDKMVANHPILGELLYALTDEAQSTTSWKTGASGEQLLGKRLDRLATDEVRVLHDRRIPSSKANIDHLVVTSTGVMVVDAKKYKGRPSSRTVGGWLSPGQTQLVVNKRNRSELILGMHKQVDVVRTILASCGEADVEVGGYLCFVEADWPLLGGEFTVDGVRVLSPKRLEKHIKHAGPLEGLRVAQLHQLLAQRLPQA